MTAWNARDAAHAESFRENADGYELHRPSYPAATVRWLLGAAHDVLDLGAGTGKLTAMIVALGARVTAVDPAHETRSYYLTASAAGRTAMLARIARVLDAHPETRGEAIGLPYLTEAWIAEPWQPGC